MSSNGSADGSTMAAEAEPKENIELFVRAGHDGECLGGCPVCQRFFMTLLNKADYNRNISLVVTTVNVGKQPAEFKTLGNRLPALAHNDETISDPDEMVLYIDKNFRYPPMAYDNVAAAAACKDVFSKFTFYIKDVSHSSTPLLAELYKLNTYLLESPHRFLTRDIPDHLDCMMLPKLQHIRVAAKAFKDFEIPASLTGFWKYMSTAYDCPVFKQSCPSDQEIVHHWLSKADGPTMDKARKVEFSLEGSARYSFDIPQE